VAYHVILGDPDIPEGTAGSPWTHLTDYLRKRWTSEAGGEMVIETTCIDTGGSNTQAVYGYVKRHKGDRVYGIKGQGGPGLPIVGNPARRRAGKKTSRPIDVYIVGVDSAKSIVYKRLRITEPGSGYCHFPQGRSAEYFRGLTAEKAVTKFVKGFPRLEWHKTSGARNEPLDCRVYAFAALVLRAPQFDKLALRRRQTMPTPKPAEAEPPPPVEVPAEDTNTRSPHTHTRNRKPLNHHVSISPRRRSPRNHGRTTPDQNRFVLCDRPRRHRNSTRGFPAEHARPRHFSHGSLDQARREHIPRQGH
jgi:phage terminase large subunit GpA-like protein